MPTRRRLLVGVVTFTVASATWPACQRPPAAPRIRRIGLLTLTSPDLGPGAPVPRLFAALRELGWIDGENLRIETRTAEGKADRLAAVAAELVQDQVEVIVTVLGPPAQAARDATTTIPIVFGPVADPVGLGLVDSLARPGRNLTGLSFIGGQLTTKQLELVGEILPRARRIGVLWYADNPGATFAVELTEASAAKTLLDLFRLKVRVAADYERAYAEAKVDGAQAILDISPPLSQTNPKLVADLAIRAQLPLFSSFAPITRAGGLLSFGPDLGAQFERLAYYVDRILKGTRPADLPVEQPATLELVVNLRTAAALGLTIPATVLVRASEVIN